MLEHILTLIPILVIVTSYSNFFGMMLYFVYCMKTFQNKHTLQLFILHTLSTTLVGYFIEHLEDAKKLMEKINIQLSHSNKLSQ